MHACVLIYVEYFHNSLAMFLHQARFRMSTHFKVQIAMVDSLTANISTRNLHHTYQIIRKSIYDCIPNSSVKT